VPPSDPIDEVFENAPQQDSNLRTRLRSALPFTASTCGNVDLTAFWGAYVWGAALTDLQTWPVSVRPGGAPPAQASGGRAWAFGAAV